MRRPAATNTGCMAGGIGLVGGVEMLLEEEEEEEEERACLWKDREEGWIWNSDTATATESASLSHFLSFSIYLSLRLA